VMGFVEWQERVTMWSSWYKRGYRGWGWGQGVLLLVASNILSEKLAISMARRSSAIKTWAKESLSH